MTAFEKKSKNGGKDFLAATILLTANQLAIHNLHSPASDIIHPADPLHLVVCLELLRDTFHRCHLLYQSNEHFLRLTVNVGKVAVQFSAGEQGCIGCPPILLQITPVALPSHADGPLFFFGQFQIRER